jgi:hypothetical protein
MMIGAESAQATINIVADYKFDTDPGAVAGGPGNATTLDSSGNGFDLTKFGSPTYSNNIYPGSTGGLSMSFDGASSYRGDNPVTNVTENFGMDALVKPADVTNGVIAINGTGCCSGFGLGLFDGAYWWIYGGILVPTFAPAVVGEWAHIAVINEDGFTSAYFNGTLIPFFDVDPHPALSPCCAADPMMLIGTDTGGGSFNGLIDEVRVFTFASGEFDVADIRVPEPATAALLGFGFAMLGWARRRRAD